MEQLPGSVEIRPETSDDHEAVRRVVVSAFGSNIEADLVERLRSSPEYVPELSLVATDHGTVVGHVMISHARIRSQEEDGGTERRISMLSPLAVLPEAQKSGIGGALVRAALGAADDRGEPLVVLEGSPLFYGRLGFEHAQRHGIELPLPSWAPSEAGQAFLDREDQRVRTVIQTLSR